MEKARQDARRPKYQRKKGATRRASDMPIWEWLQVIARQKEPPRRLLQNRKAQY